MMSGAAKVKLVETLRPGRAPLCEVVREFIVHNYPCDVGDVVIGKQVSTRHVHSISSAAEKAKVPFMRMRKALGAVWEMCKADPCGITFTRSSHRKISNFPTVFFERKRHLHLSVSEQRDVWFRPAQCHNPLGSHVDIAGLNFDYLSAHNFKIGVLLNLWLSFLDECLKKR